MQKMSEKEAIIELKRSTGCGIYKGVADVAIQALEEIQQYRAIGTVDQCREAVERMKGEEHE